ncbi:VanW family protein, partial [Neobacillus vireti]|uniref:VanW family protein n=1 Tax=Neobacillus vireti TaxID=220686 RepID=UPI00300031F1
MNFTLILGLLVFTQQMNMPDSLEITTHENPVSVVNRTNLSVSLPVIPIIDMEKFKQLLSDIDQKVSKKPNNAIIDKYGNIIPEQVGYSLNRDIFTEKVFSYYFSNGSSKLEVPLQVMYPRVDSELLGNIRSEKIGEYVTFFNSYNKERNNNISLATNAINNFVLFPGEIFSFNKVVGERTPKKGYMPA